MKKVLVPLTGRPLDRRAVASAFLVAAPFSAHVEGLSVMPQVEIRSSIESAAIPRGLVDQLIKVGQAEQSQVLEAARRLFDDFCLHHRAASGPTGAGMSATWQEATGPLAETLAEEARLADITVIAQASDGTNAMGPVIEAALFGSGRPLLLAPLIEPTSVGAAVAVAWDGGASAARAVDAAIPFLHRATKVVVLTAPLPERGRSAAPERLTGYLALHGVAASIHALEASGAGLGEALVQGALDLGCDLLVMGGYGHSRVRERVWGGVTLDVLSKPAGVAILMAH